MSIELLLERDMRSYMFKVDPAKPDSFENNWKNNSLDKLHILEQTHYFRQRVATFRCQTVHNYCFGEYATADFLRWGDTIAPGDFFVKCFVPPRNFHGEIHGIINCTDLDGQFINCNSMQETANGFQNGRFLIHDRYSEKLGKDTNFGWSAGCFILSSKDLQTFNTVLRAYKVAAGDVIKGKIVEV